jgi:hypothetical protein
MSKLPRIGSTVAGAVALLAAITTPAVASAAVSGWSIQPSPNQMFASSGLGSVSCVSASACTAVGLANDQKGNSAALAEGWNGSSWSVLPSPNLPSINGNVLTGIACSAATACTAVGSFPNKTNGADQTLAERWDGTRWSVQPTPNPDFVLNDLMAVSCPSATSCTAVGWYVNHDHGHDFTVAEQWDGTTWKMQPTPNFPGSQVDVLQGVSCTSTTACTAVGYAWPGAAGQGSTTLVERWNGTAWLIQPSPNPRNGLGSNYLTSVSCATATACSAVGYSDGGGQGGNQASFAERWNGASWTVENTPHPAGSVSTNLAGVSCTSAAACTAVGSSRVFSGNPRLLVEHWNGAVWAFQGAAMPAGSTSSSMGGVSCPVSGTCTAVGSFDNAISDSFTLAERLNGTRWSIQASPTAVSVAPSVLSGVACPMSAACIAVGSSFGSLTLAERWDGTTWSIKPTPNVALQGGVLSAVSCSDATTCTAVGHSVDGNTGILHPLAERWNGSDWTIQATNDLRGSSSALSGVSCPSATSCMAVGSFENASLVRVPLAERWDGTAWSLVATPRVPGTSELTGVACSSPTACIAVGRSKNKTLAERWNGTAWSVLTTPNPPNATASVLAGVSCTAPTACTAVGKSTNASGTTTLAERWNGSAWSIESTPNPAGARVSALAGVSCMAATACTAVGSSTGVSGTMVTLAERWDGSTWSLQPTPNAARATTSVLSGVACSSGPMCTGVGFSQTGAASEHTLIERNAGG